MRKKKIKDEGVAFQDYTVKPWYKRMFPHRWGAIEFCMFGYIGIIIMVIIIALTS